MTCAMVEEAKCHHHMWGWLQEVVRSCRGPQDFWGVGACVCVHVCGCVCGGGGGGGTQLGHRGSEFPEAIVWDNSAEAPSWPGHANLGPNEI